MPTLPEHLNTPTRADRLADLPIVPGDRADYHALRPHHYRPGHPATMTRILAVRDPAPSASDRFTGREARPRTVAVLTESLPTLSCRLRDEALGGRYGHLPPRARSTLLNQEVRCISRVIVDPRYRGLGLAVRLVRHALASATTRYTEAIAVMGRVSPFFERAGMTPYERQPLEADQRALAALAYAGLESAQLAMPADLQARIAALVPQTRVFVLAELTRWYRSNGGRGVTRRPDLATILAAARQRLLAQPVYYLHENTHAQPAEQPPAEPTQQPPAAARPADRPARRPPGQQQRHAQEADR